jgi:putative serine protease PepD
MNTATKLSTSGSPERPETNTISVEKKEKREEKVVQRKRGGGCRRIIYLVLLLLLCGLCCGLVVLTTWATGYLQNAGCRIARADSPLAASLGCKLPAAEVKVEAEGSQYPVKVSEEAPQSTAGLIDVAAVYSQTSRSIVGVGIKGDQLSTNQVIGSGFVISENGLIATNQHVVSEQEADYYVKFEGSDELVDVQKIYRDSVNDIAILEVNKKGLPSLTLGNSDNLKPGQPVVAIGNPLGRLSSTVTSGIISGLNREVDLGSSFLRSNVEKFEDTIQTDAAINPGNSGGPLLNAAGHVIGINFATVQGADNLSFAIPVSYLRTRLEELRQFGKFKLPYLGIQYRNRLITLGSEVFVGAQITGVDAQGGAAGKLKVGDVVVSYAGKDLENNSLFNLIQKSKIGDKIELGIIGSDNKRRTETVTIIELKG